MPREENKMGRWGATSYIVGNIIGSGIFISPSYIVKNTQSVGLAMLVWLLSAATATLGAFCYVELGTSIRRSGGDFAYLYHVKWYPFAFTFMCTGCVLIYPLMLAIQAETFSEYAIQGLQLYFPPEDSFTPFVLRKLLSFCTIWALLFLNFFSVRRVVARFQIATSVAKLLATAVIVGTGAYLLIFKGKTENLREPFANSNFAPGPLVNAFFSALFGYDGWDVLNFGAEEIINPKSTMFFAILVGMSCVTAVYAAINLSYFVVLSVTEVEASHAVAMTFGDAVLGNFRYAVPFLINLVMIGSINGTMFTASRYLFAAARQRQLPSYIACTNQEHDSPRAALFTHVILAFIFSFLGNIDQLINYLGFAQWLQRAFTMCALLWIRLGPAKIHVHPEAIKTPIVLPIIFLIVCSVLVVVTLAQDFATALVGIYVLIGGLFVYAVFIWEITMNRFAIYRAGAAYLNDKFARITQLTLNGQIDLDASEEGNSTEDPESVLGKRRAATLSICPDGDNKVFPADGSQRQRRRTRTSTQLQQNGLQQNGLNHQENGEVQS